MVSQLSWASFSENQVRYFSGPELQWYLYNLGLRYDHSPCLNLQDNEVSALGVNSPATGNPSSGGPTISTVGVIAACVDKHFERLPSLHEQPEVQALLLGASHIAELKERYNHWYSMTWSRVEPQLQKKIVDHLIFHILGPDAVLEDYRQVKSAQEFKQEIYQKVKTIENQSSVNVLAQITLSLILRDESLSY
jgi:hypothetical protein